MLLCSLLTGAGTGYGYFSCVLNDTHISVDKSDETIVITRQILSCLNLWKANFKDASKRNGIYIDIDI